MSANPEPRLDQSEFLTVCISPDGKPIGAKVYCRGAALPVPQVRAGRELRMVQVPVASFDSLADELDRLVAEPDRFLVRGDLIDPSREVQRRLLNDRDDAKATIRDTPKRQLFLDLDCPADKFPEPAGPRNAAYAADVWRRLGMIEDTFEDAECWWEFTGSAGAKPGVRMRFMLWVAEPVTTAQARRWCEAVNARVGFQLLDPAVYSANQPNFIAAPVLNGVADPCIERSGRIEGRECGVLPVPIERVRASSTAVAQDFIPELHAGPLPRAAEAYLSRLRPGHFHEPIKAAVGVAVAADIDDESIIERVLDCVGERGGVARVHQWRGELPRLVKWTRDQEGYKREQALAGALPHPGIDGLKPVTEARAHLRAALGRWREQAIEALELTALLPPGESPRYPVMLANVGVGLGKTESAIDMIGELLTAKGRVERVAFLVPTHKLGAELVERFAGRGIEARVWYGVTSTTEEGVARVCTEPDIRDAALQVQALDEACKRCPARAGCAYRAQHEARPQVWIASHEMLFLSPPETLRQVQAVVVDEGFWQKGLRGASEHPARLLLSTLDADPKPLQGRQREDLADLRGFLREALDQVNDGELVTREVLAAAGLSPTTVTDAIKLEWQRKPDAREALRGVEASSSAIVQALGALRESRFSMLLPQLWRQVHNVLQGEFAHLRVRKEIHAGEAGTGPGVELAWREDVHEVWRSMPALLLDATGQRAIVERFWGPVEAVEVQAELPRAVTVTQVHDTSAALSMFVRDEGLADDGKEDWRTNNVERIAQLLEVKASEHVRVAVICQKGLEDRLRARGLPANVTVDHFNAIEGRDHLRDVDLLLVIGRTLPAPSAVERMAEVLFAVPIEPIGSQYPEEVVRLHGSRSAVEARRHPNPHAEAVRTAICEGGVVQAVGRARAVNRTADRPLDILVIGNVPVPTIRPDRVVSWEATVPTPFQLAAARAGVLPLSPRAMVATGVWNTERAAEKALERVRAGSKTRHSPMEVIYRGLSGFKQGYQYRQDPGQRRWSRCYGPEDSALARQRIEALIGAVAVWEAAVPAEAPTEARPRPAPPAPTIEATAPLPPIEAPMTDKTLLHLTTGGASPLRVARELGVTPEKLDYLTRKLKKRGGLRVPPRMLPYIALAQLHGHDQVLDTIHALIDRDTGKTQ